MTDQSDSLSSRVQESFRRLSLSAATLNSASDELGKCIADLDSALKTLNLGVSTWFQIVGGTDPADLSYWSRDIGYAKIGKQWGIALRAVWGDHRWPEDEKSEEWPFNEAPRWMRIEGVEAIPELLEKLISEAEETTKKINSKVSKARALASAVATAAPTSQPKREVLSREVK